MLLNVRLTADEVRAVKGLRRAKVNVSELVRRALRAAAPSGKGANPRRSTLVREVLAAFPGKRAPTKRPPLDDRQALSNFIREQVASR